MIRVYRYDVVPDDQHALLQTLIPQEREWNRVWTAMADRFQAYLDARTDATIAVYPELSQLREAVRRTQSQVEEAYQARRDCRKRLRSKDTTAYPELKEADVQILQAKQQYREACQAWRTRLKQAAPKVPADIMIRLRQALDTECKQIIKTSVLYADTKAHIIDSWMKAENAFWKKSARLMRGRDHRVPVDRVGFCFRRGTSRLKGYGTFTGVPVTHLFEEGGCGILAFVRAESREKKRVKRCMGRFQACWTVKGAFAHRMNIALHRLPLACGNVKSTFLIGNRIHRGGIVNPRGGTEIQALPERWRWHIVLTVEYPADHDAAIATGDGCAHCAARRQHSLLSAADYWRERLALDLGENDDGSRINDVLATAQQWRNEAVARGSKAEVAQYEAWINELERTAKVRKDYRAANAVLARPAGHAVRSPASVCAIDLNWRVMPHPHTNGPGVRIGVIARHPSLSDALEPILLPPELVPSFHMVRQWETEQSLAIDAVKEYISTLSVPTELTDEHREWLQSWQVMREGRLIRLYQFLRSVGSVAPMMRVLEEWFLTHTQWHAQIRLTEAAWLRRREALYRLTAASLCASYATIVIEDLDLRRMRKTEQTDGNYGLMNSQKYANLAALSEFRSALVTAAIGRGTRIVELNPAYTTRMCSQCGMDSASDPKDLVMCCPNGHCWDQDANAAVNLLKCYLADPDAHPAILQSSQTSRRSNTRRRFAKKRERHTVQPCELAS
jgi:hypothetical protein